MKNIGTRVGGMLLAAGMLMTMLPAAAMAQAGSQTSAPADIVTAAGTETESARPLTGTDTVAINGDKTYTSLKQALEEAEENETVTLTANASLTEKVTITKNVTLVDVGYTISGVADSADVYFEITGGTFTVSNVTLTDFGGAAASTVTGAGVFKIPASAVGAEIAVDHITVRNFVRAAFDVRNGSFSISNSTIDCANEQAEGVSLTKGIVAGYDSTGTVTGTVTSSRITGANSVYEGWSASGIEISAGATVTVTDTVIDSMKGGISVARNYGHGAANVTLNNCTVTGGNFSLRIFESNSSTSAVPGSSAALTVNGGTYTGDVRISRDGGDETNGSDSTIAITGGSFDQSVKEYADAALHYEVTDGTAYTYHADATAAAAAAAAMDGATVTAINAAASATRFTVTLNHGYDSLVTTIEVAENSTMKLPTLTRSGYAFRGWSDGADSFEAGEEVTITGEITFTAQWSYLTPTDPSGPSTPSEPEELEPFGDVDESDWFYDAVVYVYEHELMQGTAPGVFSPERTITRGQLVTILWRFAGCPVVSYNGSFSDVAENAFCASAVRWAASAGIANGYGGGRFGANDPVTRQQLAAILYRYAAYQGSDVSARGDLSAYADASDVGAFATDALSWALAEDLIQGYSNRTLLPGGTASRAQAATILMRFVENIIR